MQLLSSRGGPEHGAVIACLPNITQNRMLQDMLDWPRQGVGSLAFA